MSPEGSVASLLANRFSLDGRVILVTGTLRSFESLRLDILLIFYQEVVVALVWRFLKPAWTQVPL